MNFFEYQFGKKGIASDSNPPDMEKHNRRYHPHGFTDHTKCKYRGYGQGTSPNGDEHGNSFNYQSFASPVEARKWLLENTGIEAFHITSPRQIITDFGFSPDLMQTFIVCGDPVSEETYDFDCLVFASVCKDIKTRFGDVIFPPAAFLPYNFFNKIRKRGYSSLDRRHGYDCFISIGDFTGIEETAFGHSVEAFPFDVARHELGHSMATELAYSRFNGLTEKDWNPEALAKNNMIMPWSVDDLEESLADLFSVRIGPLYRQGSLPREIEDFLVSMLYQKENTAGGLTMDEIPRKPRHDDKLPFQYKVGVFPLPPPPNGEIAWLDRETWKYVVFNTHEDMFRYAMGKMAIPVDLQNRLIDECSDRKWSRRDTGIVKTLYYGGWNYDEIVESIKRRQP